MRSPLHRSIVLFLVALALSACGSARPPAAVVEGETISDAQLRDQMVLFSFLGSLQQQPCGQAQPRESQDAACARFTLSSLIEEDLVKHYATAHNITVSDGVVRSAIAQLQSNLGGAAKLDAKLKAGGISRPELVVLARRLLLLQKARSAIGAAAVTDAQLRQAYEQQQQQFTEIHAKHILVTSRSLAQRIAAEATARNFGELARKYSTDPSSSANGGDLGTIPASSLDPAFVQAALALSPGEISGPVQTQYGWHVIMLVSTRVQSFDQVRAQLSGSLESQAYARWLGERLRDADVRVNPKYGRLDQQTGQVVPVHSTASTSAAAPTPSATAAP